MMPGSSERTIGADDAAPGMWAALRDLYRHRELLAGWTLREINVRYKQSLLGAAWAIAQPLSLMLVYTVVFAFFVRIPSDGIPYPIFAYAALLPWTFLASSITFGAPSLINNANLVTKVYFPREILPLASVAASGVDFLVASALFVVLLIFYAAPVGATLIWLPVLLSAQIILTIAVVLVAAAVNVFYRDVRFVIPLATQLWFYATPVIYPVTVVPERIRVLYMLNPMAGIIDAYREVLLHGRSPNLAYLGLAMVSSVCLCWAAFRFFKRVEMSFADVI